MTIFRKPKVRLKVVFFGACGAGGSGGLGASTGADCFAR